MGGWGFGEPLVEPGQGAQDIVAAVCRLDEDVAFVGIDDELGGNVKSFEGMPPLDGLLHRNFAIAITDKDERRSFDGLDEANRIAFGVDGRIVVDGSAEERNHPLIEIVHAVIAEPIG